MPIAISSSLTTRFVDFVDDLAPDSIRVGDLYDVLSGREALRCLTSASKIFELGDGVTLRRLRSEDMTTSGLGFELEISFGGKFYNAIGHFPAADHPAWQQGEMRLAIDLPGLTDSPRAHSDRSKLSQAAVDSGAISIALGGARGSIPVPLLHLLRMHDGMSYGNMELGGQDGPALVSYLLDQLPSQLEAYTTEQGLPAVSFDRDNVLALGLSNGGALAGKLVAAGAVRNALVFSGPISPVVKEYTSASPTNVFIVEGMHDSIVPMDGPGIFSANFIPGDEAAELFAKRNGTGPLTDDVPGFLAAFEQAGVSIRSSGDETHGMVVHIVIDDNGHAVPGSNPMASEEVDTMIGLQASGKISGQELLKAVLAATA